MQDYTEINQTIKALQHQVDEQTSQLRQLNEQLQEEIRKRKLLEEQLCTSDKLLEEKIRNCEWKMRSAFEAMTDIVLFLNTQGNQLKDIEILPTNPSRLYEPGTDIIAQTVEQFFQEKTAKTWLGKVQQALDSQATLNFDYSLSLKGREVWFTATISPISDNSVICVARDICDRKRAEQALQESESRFQKLANNIPGELYIVVQQPDGFTRFEYMSPACRNIQELEPEQVLENSALIYDQIYPDDRPTFHKAEAESAQTLEPLAHEWRIVTPSGKLKWLSAKSRPERRSNGEIVWYSALFDVTERKQAQIELHQQNQRLQHEIRVRQRAEEEIFFLLSTTQAIAEADDSHSALSIILRSCCETIGWDFGEAWIPSQDASLLEYSQSWYASDPSLQEFSNQSLTLQFAQNCGLPGRVWSSQKPEWIEDVSIQLPQVFRRSHMAAAAGLKAGFGVPILFNNQVLAILVFFKRGASPRQRHVVELINAVATQLGSLIQRKQTEEALRMAEEKYHSIVENAVEGIFQVSLSGQYLSANSALARIYGYDSPADLINSVQDISQQLYVNPNHYQEFTAAIEADNQVKDFESLVYRKDGSTIWISESTRAVRERDGKLLYYEGTVSEITERKLIQEALKFEQEQAEKLLLNLLPAPIAKRLQQGEYLIAERFEEVSVLFADLVGFTEFSARKTPEELVSILNIIFSWFDELAQRYGLEKIKTIGDAYMVVGGLPTFRPDHASAVAQMALAMQAAMVSINTQIGETFTLRIGINTGPVVAGVIGLNKFIYDLWGDTVNTASRMEANGIPGEIQVTATTYERLKGQFFLEERGLIPIKGKGEMITYLLRG